MDGYSRDYDDAVEESVRPSSDLSIRNTSPVPSPDGGTTGSDAEEFEVTDYRAEIETGNLSRTCSVLTDLKSLDHVVFESATESDSHCHYMFKVERERASEVLSTIEGLNPKNLSENTRTIQRLVDDFTSERELLEAKQESIEETLQSALTAYSEITALASSTQNAEALASIITSRVEIIERLTQESIEVSAQLERLARAQEEALDGLEYTDFNVFVSERKFVDFERLGDSWQRAVEKFFHTVNKALQDATVNLLAFLVALIPYVLYFFILIIFAKYGWRLVRYVWNR
jgi:hypothetical protein